MRSAFGQNIHVVFFHFVRGVVEIDVAYAAEYIFEYVVFAFFAFDKVIGVGVGDSYAFDKYGHVEIADEVRDLFVGYVAVADVMKRVDPLLSRVSFHCSRFRSPKAACALIMLINAIIMCIY